MWECPAVLAQVTAVQSRVFYSMVPPRTLQAALGEVLPVLILVQIQTSQSPLMRLQGLHFNVIKSKDSDLTQCGQRDSSLSFFSMVNMMMFSAISQSSWISCFSVFDRIGLLYNQSVVRCGHVICFGQPNLSISDMCYFWVEDIRASLCFALFSFSIWSANQQHVRQ